MSKKIAVFTIVRDEKEWLPLWLSYYKKCADYVLILDNDSVDGSTSGLDVDVRLVSSEHAFDHSWMLETIEAVQKELLKNFDYVIFAEADEFLVHEDYDLRDYVLSLDVECVQAVGYNVIQMLSESFSDFDSDILERRSFMEKETHYDKSLISRVPLFWGWGLHRLVNRTCVVDPKLLLVHLHKLNKDYAFERRLIRSKWNWKDEDMEKKRGWHYHLTEKKKFEDWYDPKVIVKIPDWVKKRLSEGFR